MKWMRERDLLIAQTMAFVQSVTGKKPDAGMFAGVPEAATATTITTTVIDVAAMVTETTVISEPARESEPAVRIRAVHIRVVQLRTGQIGATEVRATQADPRSARRAAVRCPIRDQGTDCELPRASRALPARARRVLQRDHGQGPRRLGRKRRAATIRQIATEARPPRLLSIFPLLPIFSRHHAAGDLRNASRVSLVARARRIPAPYWSRTPTAAPR